MIANAWNANSSGWRIAVYVALVLLPIPLIAGAPQAFFHHGAPDFDQAVFSYVARVWNAGGLPYKDAWDHKGPLVYAIYAAVLRLDGDQLAGLVIIPWLGLVTSCLLLRRLVSTAYGEFGAFASICAFLLVQLRTFHPGGYTEDIATPFCLLALLGTLRIIQTSDFKVSGRWAAAFGLSLGCVLMIRPNNAAPFVGCAATLLLSLKFRTSRALISDFVLAIAGTIVATGIFLFYFASHGALADFKSAYIDYNRIYAHVAMADRAKAAIHFLKSGIKQATMLICPLGVWLTLSKQAGEDGERRVSKAFWIGNFIGLIATFVSCALSGRLYAHYETPLAMYAGLYAAPVASFAASRISAPERADLRRSVSVVGAIASLAGTIWLGLITRKELTRKVLLPEGSRYVAEHSTPQDTLLVWGDAGVYAVTDRFAPERFFYFLPLLSDSYAPSSPASFAELLKGDPPTMILDNARGRSEFSIGLAPEDRLRASTDPPSYRQAENGDLTPIRNFVQEHYRRIKLSPTCDVYLINRS